MNKIKNNGILLKQINVDLVKEKIRSSKYLTRVDLSNITGLSLTTCSNILNELIESGEVIEIDLAKSDGGRPAKQFAYNAKYGSILCMFARTEGGVNSIGYTVTDLAGEIIKQDFIDFDLIDYCVIDCLIETLFKEYDNIKAIGIGVQGEIHQGIVSYCDIEELTGINLEEQLRKKYEVEVTIESDMNLVAYGFYKYECNTKDESVAVIFAPKEYCWGAGMIVNGQILKGSTHFASQVSFLPLAVSRTELLELSKNQKESILLMINTMIAIIALINPNTIVLTGEAVPLDAHDEIFDGCLKFIPKENMPQIIYREDVRNIYLDGLIAMTLESLSCGVELAKRSNAGE